MCSVLSICILCFLTTVFAPGLRLLLLRLPTGFCILDIDFLPACLTCACIPELNEMSVSKEPQPSTSCSEDNIPETCQSTSSREPPVKRRLYVKEVKSMWNLTKVFRELGTRGQAIAFLEERGMIPKTKMCDYHKKPMLVDYSANKTVGSFVCPKGVCKQKSKVSRCKGTWFENIKIELPQVFYLMYAYVSRWSYEITIKEDFTKREQCLSKATICEWFNYFREVVVLYQIDKQTFDGKIGGPGKIVQIDESKFGKRKYIKGRHIEDCWVLGMIENDSEDLRLEICPDNIRSADTLIPLIKKHVAEGTTIHTDKWSAYSGLENHGFIHKIVSHSNPENPFVGPDGAHTQRILAQWSVVKRFFVNDHSNNREHFTDFIYEYLWRREIIKYKLDPFEKLLDAIKYAYKQYSHINIESPLFKELMDEHLDPFEDQSEIDCSIPVISENIVNFGKKYILDEITGELKEDLELFD